MNYSSAVMLINQNIRAVHVTYEPKDQSGREPQSYTFKTLDPNIATGDYVVIPTTTRHMQTVGQVAAVDVDVDFESDIELKWIIGKVPTQEHAQILAEESKWVAALKQAEKRRKREEIKKSMFAMYEGQTQELESIQNLSALTALEHKSETVR